MIEQTDSTVIVEGVNNIEPLIQSDSIVGVDSLSVFASKLDSLNVNDLILDAGQTDIAKSVITESIVILGLLIVVTIGVIACLYYIITLYKKLQNDLTKMNNQITKNDKNIEAVILENTTKIEKTVAEYKIQVEEVVNRGCKNIEGIITTIEQKIDSAVTKKHKDAIDNGSRLKEASKPELKVYAELEKIRCELEKIRCEINRTQSYKDDKSIERKSNGHELLSGEIEAIAKMDDGLNDKVLGLLKTIPVNTKGNYHRTIDLSQDSSKQKNVVVIGDIHCDFKSLSTLLNSLINDKSYDYINNGYIVCLGDYVDRGSSLMKTVCLLLTFKKIMGDRFIMLKGNHESFVYSDNMVYTGVKHSDTTAFLNNNCSKELCQLFVEYFSSLPIYCRVLTENKRILLVHGGVPRDVFMDAGGYIDKVSGELITTDSVNIDSTLVSMMWTDPHEYKKKGQYGDSKRVEFGAMQFERFMAEADLDVLIRSHESERDGYKVFYKDSEYTKRTLYTIFSTGGTDNLDSGYHEDVDSPKYVVIQNSLDEETIINLNNIH